MKATVQIFLSYVREDEKKVENLYRKLSEAGFKPWMAQKDLLPGERKESSIRRAIRRSDFFLACLSAHSVGRRGFIQKEFRQALDIWQEKLEEDIYLIPVRLADCEPPESLRGLELVDLFEEDGWTRLMKALQAGMERRAEEIKPVVQEPTPLEPYPAYEEPPPVMERATPVREQVPPSAPTAPPSGPIRQLATLIRAHRKAGDPPYTLLLGSSLSLTPGVRQAVCGSEDWETFWTAMQRLSAVERRALMAGPLAGLNLASGYRCLAELTRAGYFNIILTANIDDALDNALRVLPASECQVLCHGQTPAQEIVAALSRPAPRVKAVKLRGDINAYKLPLTPGGQFEFPKELEEAVEQRLSQDTILVGDISSDTDIQRCIRQGEGALWVVVPEEPRPDGFLYKAKQARPQGKVITGAEAEFVPFFSALARELGSGKQQ